MAIEKLNKQFRAGERLSTGKLNAITTKVDELVEETNKYDGVAEALEALSPDQSGALALATKVNEMEEIKADVNSHNKTMGVGSSDCLAPNGGVEYREIIGAARQLGNAPECDANHTIGDDVVNVGLDDMMGDVLGGNQVVNPNRNIKYTFKEIATHLGENKWGYHGTGVPADNDDILDESVLTSGHRFMTFGNVDGTFSSGAYLQITYGIENVYNGWFSYIGTSDTNRSVRVHSSGASSVFDADIEISCLDLTALFPTDLTFVNNLTKNDALKVLHRLNIFAYEGNTQLEEDTLQLGAEVIAKMGYVEPKLTFGTCGRIHILDGSKVTGDANPAIKQTIDMRATKKAAWDKLKQQLTARGIDIPTSAEKPIEFKVNDSAGVKWHKDHLEVSAWMVDLGTLNWVYESNSNIFYTTNNFGLANSTNVLCLAYKTSTIRYFNQAVNGTISTANGAVSGNIISVFVKDESYTSASAFKAAMQGQYLIYPLDTPITIYYDQPMNLNLIEMNKTDLFGMDDIDGNPMYRVRIEQGSNGLKTYVSPDFTWVEQHKELPAPIEATIKGLGLRVDYSKIAQLNQALAILMADKMGIAADKLGVVDLGRFTFVKIKGSATANVHYFGHDRLAEKINAVYETTPIPSNVLIAGYNTIAGTYIGDRGYDVMDNVIGFNATGNLYVQSSKFENFTEEQFNKQMQGVFLFYEKA